MELTLANICSTATALIQGRTDITLSDASFYANLAYQEVATRIRYTADEALAISSTTSGENRISLPTDFAYPISVSNTSIAGAAPVFGTTTRVLRQVEADALDSLTTVLGVPESYALYSTWLELWPSPDSAYSIQIRYGARLSSMVTSTSTPALDARWHLPIAFKTAALLAATKNDLEGEAVNNARYLGAMGSTPTDLALRQRDKGSMRVQFVRGR